MTHRVLRVSAIALGAAALVSLSPLSAASAATSATSPETVHHAYVHHSTPHAHAIWRNGRRYVWNGHSYGYGYNPGAAVAAGVIGGIAGAAAGYPYSCTNWPYYGSCPAYGWGGDYGPYWGGYYGAYGYGPGYYGGYAITGAATVTPSMGERLGSPAGTSATWAASAAAMRAASAAATSAAAGTSPAELAARMTLRLRAAILGRPISFRETRAVKCAVFARETEPNRALPAPPNVCGSRKAPANRFCMKEDAPLGLRRSLLEGTVRRLVRS